NTRKSSPRNARARCSSVTTMPSSGSNTETSTMAGDSFLSELAVGTQLARRARVTRTRVRQQLVEQTNDGRDALGGNEQVVLGNRKANAPRRIERRQKRGLHHQRKITVA